MRWRCSWFELGDGAGQPGGGPAGRESIKARSRCDRALGQSAALSVVGAVQAARGRSRLEAAEVGAKSEFTLSLPC